MTVVVCCQVDKARPSNFHPRRPEGQRTGHQIQSSLSLGASSCRSTASTRSVIDHYPASFSARGRAVVPAHSTQEDKRLDRPAVSYECGNNFQRARGQRAHALLCRMYEASKLAAPVMIVYSRGLGSLLTLTVHTSVLHSMYVVVRPSRRTVAVWSTTDCVPGFGTVGTSRSQRQQSKQNDPSS